MPIYKSNGRLIYFAHIPKCAGTSVENYLQARLGKAAFLDRRFLAGGERWSKTSPQHIDAESLNRLFPADFFDAAFAVVRHPADRLLSAFYFQRDVEKKIKRDAVFSNWLVKLQEKLRENQFAFDNHFRQQTELIPSECQIFRLEDGLKKVTEYLDEVLGEQDTQLEIGNFNSNISGRKGADVDLTTSDHEIIERIFSLDYEKFGYELRSIKTKIVGEPESRNESETLLSGKTRSAAVHLEGPLTFAIKNPAPNHRKGWFWGETFFATGLANALKRKGHNVSTQMRRRWDEQAEEDENSIDIVLRRPGRHYAPKPGRRLIVWVLYSGRGGLSAVEVDSAHHIFVSSKLEANVLANQHGEDKISTLLQAFDADRMSPDGVKNISNVLYVGNHYAQKSRLSVRMALKYGVDIDLYGNNWKATEAEHLVKSDFIDNTELAPYYRGAKVVLNDHEHEMGVKGFVSNRIFDVLASGVPVISDQISGLPDEFSKWVGIYAKEDHFVDLVERACEEGPVRRAERVDFARHIREIHSFDQRADVIIEAARTSSSSCKRRYFQSNKATG